MKKTATSITKAPLISVVIPVYNEAANIPVLTDELSAVFKKLPYKFDVLFVDDGSTDTTYRTVQELQQKDKRVKALSFSRNFGHQAALTAGLEFARGDAVITMDGDLQHPPSLIPALLEQWRNGSQIVYTVREETEGEPFLKRLTSKLFYRLLNAFSQTSVQPFAADFRLLDRKGKFTRFANRGSRNTKSTLYDSHKPQRFFNRRQLVFEKLWSTREKQESDNEIDY